MTIDELLLNINDCTFDDILCQTTIQTDEDKARYQAAGYYLAHTENEIRDILPGVNTACVYYTTSISMGCLYYNPETLAVTPIHLELLSGDISSKFTSQSTLDVIFQAEKTMKAFSPAELMRILHLCLPDRMRLEYLAKIYKRYGAGPMMYKIFMDTYVASDYGFDGIDADVLNGIIQSKTEEERQETARMLQDLPDEITIYRGGNSASVDYHKAYSWTLDISIANFFACRRGSDDGYIAKATVSKADVIEYLFNRAEAEVLVYPEKLTITEVIPIHGMPFLSDVLPKVNSLYQEYRSILNRLKFTHDTDEHGKMHSLRVLMLTQIIAHMMKLPTKERIILAEAAVFHDIKRDNDDVDETHGNRAAAYYTKVQRQANVFTKFLCKYHCLPDEVCYAAIEQQDKLRKNKALVTRLLQVFKDADALDRVRFGIRSLDLNQLRVPVSRELTLVARLLLENLKL